MSTKRIQNETGYYHITGRGNGKQIIFNDDDDYLRYLNFLAKYNQNLSIEILAYCLMSNHIHLLIYDPEFNMNKLFRKVHSMYSRSFNYKYERTGNLFQGRFNSKSIDNDKQLFAALRYVLLNPEEAGFCKASDYKWSSYKLYGHRGSKLNTKRIEELIGSVNDFENLVNSKDVDTKYRPNDIEENYLKNKMLKKFNMNVSTVAVSLPKKRRDEIILFLNSIGASYKQIVRLTGVSYGIILRVVTNYFKYQNRENTTSKSSVSPGEIE